MSSCNLELKILKKRLNDNLMEQIDKLYQLFLECRKISIDSREIVSLAENGEKVMFFALKGDNFDGNKFVNQALSNGAVYCISDDSSFADDSRVVIVEDSLKALQQLAFYHRTQLKAKFIAITGTNGKTTTKELLNAVLSEQFNVVCTKGNFNNHIGVPLTLLSIDESCELAIIEMGANHHREIKQLCELAQPDCGLITNIGKAHLEGFRSQEGVAKAKGEMFDYLADHQGEIFYNSSCKWLAGIVEKISLTSAHQHSYSTDNLDILANEKGEVSVSYKNIQYNSNLVGEYNKFNIVAAIELGCYFGVDTDKIKHAISSYKPVNKRSQFVEGKFNKVILDAYNANPSSVEVALDNFGKALDDPKLVILADMKELGKESVNEHIAIIEQLNRMNFDKVILVGLDYRRAMEHCFIMADWYESADYLVKSLVAKPIKNFTVFVKGSNSMRLDKVVEHL